MQPSKIVHILLGKANPERSNGVNKVVFELAMSQHANGQNVEIWGITKVPTINFPERPFVTRLFQDSKLKFFLSKELKQAIKAADSDTIFHLHGGFLPQMYSVSRCIVKSMKHYIYTAHGAYNTQAMKRSLFKKRVFIAAFERSLVNDAKFLHAIGESEISGMEAVFGKEVPVRLVPNGHRSVKDRKVRNQVSAETLQFGFVGRIDIVTKGLDILLDGFGQYLRDGNKGRLHIAGDGKDFKQLQARIHELGLNDNVSLYGAIFGEEKESFFQKLDYFCLTSRNEGLPGVVLEALDHGLPCIVSKETNTGDAILSYNAGFVLEKNDALHLKKSLEQLVLPDAHNLYERKGQNARALIQEKFNWDVLSGQLIQAYYEV